MNESELDRKDEEMDVMKEGGGEVSTRSLETIAAEINAIKSQTMAVITNNSIEIGKRLCEAKRIIGHGNWLEWIKTSVNYSEKTAEQFMAIYKKFGVEGNQLKLFGEDMDASKVKKLNYSSLVALLAIKDDDERASFINSENVEEMSTRELKARIKELKEAKEKAENARQASDEELVRMRKQQYTAHEEMTAKISQLESELETTKTVRDSVRDQLDRAKTALKEAESRPVATAVVKEIPEETKKEIEEMKRRLAEANETIESLRKEGARDENETRFLSAFVDVKKGVQTMIGALSSMKDATMREKYSGAAKRFLEMMADMTGGKK